MYLLTLILFLTEYGIVEVLDVFVFQPFLSCPLFSQKTNKELAAANHGNPNLSNGLTSFLSSASGFSRSLCLLKQFTSSSLLLSVCAADIDMLSDPLIPQKRFSANVQKLCVLFSGFVVRKEVR
ncbi:hypothetical protein L596_012988 [Steinernema carpocapsae]|uniref:Uncharacterized protein n=1 Tax=Steinernema carpocapsae TaxID=34508 RepID=A0A4U5NZH9_STECR|nr:hypothetical protein L596_012988 [Steinernema carpocapsae]